ncbi:hypothetical protein BC830DRAFT_1229049 [Chytriomyces sp. MP71]|nr:hypothetical protein BC830DRAFT_1229049 [Chytriomyces sp. MP71]
MAAISNDTVDPYFSDLDASLPTILTLQVASIGLFGLGLLLNGYLLVCSLVAKAWGILFSRIDRIMLGLSLSTFTFALMLVVQLSIRSQNAEDTWFLFMVPVNLCFTAYCTVALAMQRLFLIRRRSDAETTRYFAVAAVVPLIVCVSFVVIVAILCTARTTTTLVEGNSAYAGVLIVVTLAVVASNFGLYAATYRESIKLLRTAMAASDPGLYRSITRQQRTTEELEFSSREDETTRLARLEVARIRVERKMLRNCILFGSSVLLFYLPTIFYQVILNWVGFETARQQFLLLAVANICQGLESVITPFLIFNFNRDLRYISLPCVRRDGESKT